MCGWRFCVHICKCAVYVWRSRVTSLPHQCDQRGRDPHPVAPCPGLPAATSLRQRLGNYACKESWEWAASDFDPFVLPLDFSVPEL